MVFLFSFKEKYCFPPQSLPLFFILCGCVEEDGMQFETSEDIEIYPSFDSMNIKEDLLRGIYAYGFERPSAVQKRAIIPAVRGQDVIVQVTFLSQPFL